MCKKFSRSRQDLKSYLKQTNSAYVYTTYFRSYLLDINKGQSHYSSISENGMNSSGNNEETQSMRSRKMGILLWEISVEICSMNCDWVILATASLSWLLKRIIKRIVPSSQYLFLFNCNVMLQPNINELMQHPQFIGSRMKIIASGMKKQRQQFIGSKMKIIASRMKKQRA